VPALQTRLYRTPSMVSSKKSSTVLAEKGHLPGLGPAFGLDVGSTVDSAIIEIAADLNSGRKLCK